MSMTVSDFSFTQKFWRRKFKEPNVVMGSQLPDEGNQPVTCLFAVFPVAGEMFDEELLYGIFDHLTGDRSPG